MMVMIMVLEVRRTKMGKMILEAAPTPFEPVMKGEEEMGKIRRFS